MAGTITVGELLSDPTSGNKITIGSGTTLDLSSGEGSVTGAGKVLQVVRTQITNGPAIATETNTDIGLQATITPISTSSKILAQWSIHCRTQTASDTGYGNRLLRGSTSVWDTATSFFIYNTHNRGSNRSFYSYNYLDSPSTTSATTYKIQVRSQSSYALEISDNGNQSTLILMEIGA